MLPNASHRHLIGCADLIPCPLGVGEGSTASDTAPGRQPTTSQRPNFLRVRQPVCAALGIVGTEDAADPSCPTQTWRPLGQPRCACCPTMHLVLVGAMSCHQSLQESATSAAAHELRVALRVCKLCLVCGPHQGFCIRWWLLFIVQLRGATSQHPEFMSLGRRVVSAEQRPLLAG